MKLLVIKVENCCRFSVSDGGPAAYEEETTRTVSFTAVG